jgi:hypothetical protein
LVAYLFFHELAPGADAVGYEEGLRRFHAALAGAGVPGFIGSRTYRVGPQYCDWYVVATSAALDPLNDAAVSGRRSASHSDVARLAVNFTGKLLTLAAGEYDSDARSEVRFSKPHGVTYPDLYRRLEPWTNRPGVSMWRRMMVLGPPPEFCLIAALDISLPDDLEPDVFRREPL